MSDPICSAKEVAETFQAWGVFAATVAGGFWAMGKLLRFRETQPRAAVSIGALPHFLPDGAAILRAVLAIRNTGKTVLRLERYQVGAYLVEPMPDEVIETIASGGDPAPHRGQISWPEISAREFSGGDAAGEIEPGEIEEVHCDLVIPKMAKVVQLYGYVYNTAKQGRELGWTCFRYLRISADRVEALSYEPEEPAKAAESSASTSSSQAAIGSSTARAPASVPATDTSDQAST